MKTIGGLRKLRHCGGVQPRPAADSVGEVGVSGGRAQPTGSTRSGTGANLARRRRRRSNDQQRLAEKTAAGTREQPWRREVTFIGLLVRAMPHTARPGRATRGMTHWVAVMLTVNLIVVAGIWLVADPAHYRFDCEYRYLPSVQQTFGFQRGRFNPAAATSTPVVAEFRAKQVALPIEGTTRVRQSVEDLNTCGREGAETGSNQRPAAEPAPFQPTASITSPSAVFVARRAGP